MDQVGNFTISRVAILLFLPPIQTGIVLEPMCGGLHHSFIHK